MTQNQSLERRQPLVRRERKSSGGMGLWSVVGGAALLAVAAMVVVSIPDIQRYMKIRAM